MGTILEMRPAANAALPDRRPRALQLQGLAREAFALAIWNCIYEEPDARIPQAGHVLVSDPLPSGVVLCTLVHDGSVYKGSVRAASHNAVKAEVHYRRSLSKADAEFLFSKRESAAVREEYIFLHHGE